MNNFNTITASFIVVAITIEMAACAPFLGSTADNLDGGSNCRAYPFDMPIKEDGCEPTSVKNNYCFGQCVSRVFHNGKGSCRICFPDQRYQKIVFLKCTRTVDGQQVIVQEPRQIEIVKTCSCSQCPKVDLRRYMSRAMTD